MKKLILILSVAISMLLSVDTVAQSGFQSNYYYTQQYSISIQRANYNSYWEIVNGVRYKYEIWRKAKWYRKTGTYSYRVWGRDNWGNYRWYTQSGYGTYWYYIWVNYKRYYYYDQYGYKYYTN